MELLHCRDPPPDQDGQNAVLSACAKALNLGIAASDAVVGERGFRWACRNRLLGAASLSRKWHDVTLEISYLSKSCFSGEIERAEGDATTFSVVVLTLTSSFPFLQLLSHWCCI